MEKPQTPRKSLPVSPSPKVRVVVRVRPFLPAHDESPNLSATLVDAVNLDSGDEITVLLKDLCSSRQECYKLDSFFDQGDDISQIFLREVELVVPRVLEGCNATVFAYGATGSGKTYTMQGTDENPGLIPLALSSIFTSSESSGCSVRVSYYEIYLDRCYDLLEPKAKEIMVLEDKDGQVQLKGLSKVPVQSMAEFGEVFSCGVQRRKVAHIGLNDVSSRSHSVLSVFVSKDTVCGKLNLIDLAGNENNKRTLNEGIRLQESAKINQSLFALSNVIYALNNNEQRIPYRASKLTRILQDSLGGKSQALMVACLNPGSYKEAVHTVSLAARSRHTGNFMSTGPRNDTPKVEEDMEAKLQAWLESKGKTKTVQRSYSSHFRSGTVPNSSSCQKRSYMIKSASKPANNYEGSISRKLFDTIEPTGQSLDFLPDNSKEKDVSANIVESTEERASLLSADDHPMETRNDKDKDFAAVDGSSLSGTKSNAVPSNFIKQLSVDENISELEKSMRKVLSPVNSTETPLKGLASDNKTCVVSLEPNTPKTVSGLAYNAEEIHFAGTPLDKFYALGSNLKESLAMQYVDFLNAASKEELLSLKGIGHKTAEYILQMREDDPQPFKTLSDLENIGLSSRQIHNMFKKAASGVFA